MKTNIYKLHVAYQGLENKLWRYDKNARVSFSTI